MAGLHCPFQGCTAHGFSRQALVNIHIRKFHFPELEKGKGGDMEALRERQKKQWSSWLVANGLPNTNLLNGAPIVQSDEEDDDGDDDADDSGGGGDDDDDGSTSIGSSNINVQDPIHDAKSASGLSNISKPSKHESNRDMSCKLRRVLNIIRTIDESNLDVGPRHANDSHKIICEDGRPWFADSRSIESEDEEAMF